MSSKAYVNDIKNLSKWIKSRWKMYIWDINWSIIYLSFVVELVVSESEAVELLPFCQIYPTYAYAVDHDVTKKKTYTT